MSVSVSLSIVTYHPDFGQLEALFESVHEAVGRARSTGLLSECPVTIVDNSTDGAICDRLTAIADKANALDEVVVSVDCTDRNLGYGNAHNRVILESGADLHLVLNPDVVLDQDALAEALRYMQAHPEVGLLGPRGTDEQGTPLYLSKRYPSVFDLLLRGFAPVRLRRLFSKRLAHYEMRDLDEQEPSTGIPIVSGCFMVARTALLKKLGGFDPRFFLYFEDFDLSLRMGEVALVACVPAVCIRHFGGQAARKGPGHVWMFIRSAIRFFRLHGWRWW